MKLSRSVVLSALAFVLAVTSASAATLRFVNWDKAGKGNVTAFDLGAGNVAWQTKVSDSVNFVEEVPDGILVGSDDGRLYLLKAADGRMIWVAVLGKPVNEFHGASEEGFLVSHDKRAYWLVDRGGKLKARWE